MEPEAHRLDREAMLAEHQAVARRIQREVDDAVDAAAETRRASFEQAHSDVGEGAGDEPAGG
jgi:hypothetical protein